MEITGTKKAPFYFEQDLLNQAKILEAARVSNKKQKVVCLSDIK